MFRNTRNRKYLLAGLLAGLTLAVAPAMAHSGKHHRAPQATLSAQAETEVEQDTVTVSLVAELSAETQAEVSETLNKKLDSVMKDAKGHDGVDARSGSYRIWPSTGQDGRITEWRGRAEIILESRDFDAASKLAGQLADRMPISGLSFSVSSERRAEAEQALLTQAVKAFQSRSQALASALGFSSYRLVSIELGGNGVTPVAAPRMMSAMAAGKAAAPMEGGQEVVSVMVHGKIALQTKQKAIHQ